MESLSYLRKELDDVWFPIVVGKNEIADQFIDRIQF